MTSLRRRVVWLCLAAVLVGFGCGPFVDSEPPVISVGEHDFTHADLDRFVNSRTGLGASLDAPLLSTLLDEFAREQLLLIAADEADIEVSRARLQSEIAALEQGPGAEVLQPETEQPPEETDSDQVTEAVPFRDEVRNRLRVEQLISEVVLDGLEVTDEAALLEFETSRAFYARPETVTLSEQRFDDRAAAEAAVARQDEEDDDAEDEMDVFHAIGTFRRGELPDAVEQTVFGLDPGDTTGVVETSSGFRVFRVDERLPAGPLEFEEVKDVVHMTVLQREADARVEAFVADLRNRHPVTIHADRLRFPYVGLLSE